MLWRLKSNALSLRKQCSDSPKAMLSASEGNALTFRGQNSTSQITLFLHLFSTSFFQNNVSRVTIFTTHWLSIVSNVTPFPTCHARNSMKTSDLRPSVTGDTLFQLFWVKLFTCCVPALLIKKIFFSSQNRSLLPLRHFAAIRNTFIINESCRVAAIAAKNKNYR